MSETHARPAGLRIVRPSPSATQAPIGTAFVPRTRQELDADALRLQSALLVSARRYAQARQGNLRALFWLVAIVSAAALILTLTGGQA